MPPERAAPPVVFLTGAAGGIGRAVVDRLRASARIFATDLSLAAVPCGESDFAAMSVDVCDETSIARGLEECLRAFRRVDHVVHLAGRAGRGPIDAVDRQEWQALLDVNLTSAFLLAKAAHPHLRATRGSLTLMSSTNALNGGSALSGPAYAAAKAGVLNLTRYLAKEWAPEGIRVNCLAPGPIDTPMVARFAPEVRERLAASVPLGRIGRAGEVAAAVAYLIGADAAFLTGTVHNVSGGVVLD